MGRDNFAILKKIANLWLLFNVVMIIVSYLPHWPMPYISWINLSLYFLAFVSTIYIAKAEKFNRDTLIPLAFLFFLYAVPSVFLILIGKDFSFGSDTLSWLAFRYYYLIILFFFAYSILYYAAKNALQPGKPVLLNAATFIFVAAVFLVHFHVLIFNPTVPHYNELLIAKKFTYYILPLFSVFLYGVLNPFLKPKHGEYTHAIMAILAFLSLREFAITLSEMKNVFFFGTDQYFLALTLIILNFFLYKKINFVYSTAGQIYTKILYNDLQIPNLKLESREKGRLSKFALFVYFIYLKRAMFIPLSFIILFFIKYLEPPLIVSLNLIFIGLMLFIIILFMVYTFNRKQKKDGYIISNFDH